MGDMEISGNRRQWLYIAIIVYCNEFYRDQTRRLACFVLFAKIS